MISVTSSISDAVGCSARVHSNGFFGARGGPPRRDGPADAPRRGGEAADGLDYSARHAEDLRASEIAQKARSSRMLSPKPLETGRYAVVIDRRALSRLLSALFLLLRRLASAAPESLGGQSGDADREPAPEHL